MCTALAASNFLIELIYPSYGINYTKSYLLVASHTLECRNSAIRVSYPRTVNELLLLYFFFLLLLSIEDNPIVLFVQRYFLELK